TAATGGGTQALANDVVALAAAMVAQGVDPAEMILVAAATEAVKIKLISGPNFDLRVLSTVGLPAKTIAAFAPAGVACAYEGPPNVMTSWETSITYADPGQAAMTAATQSLMQQDGVGINVRANATWAVVVPGAAQVINSVTW